MDVRTALASLPAGDQEILRLVGWEQLVLAEVAVVLGCSRVAAKVRLHRARRRLLATLDRDQPDRDRPADAVPAPLRS